MERVEHHYTKTIDRQAQVLERSRILTAYCDRLEQRIATDNLDALELASMRA